MSTLSSTNVMDVNLVLKERTHMRLCLNMLIFTHNLGNWLISAFPVITYIPSKPGQTDLVLVCDQNSVGLCTQDYTPLRVAVMICG